LAATQAGFTGGSSDGKACRLTGALANLVVSELFMAAVTVGFVAAVLALTKVIVLAFVTLEGHRGEITAFVGAITKRLFAAKPAPTKVIFAVFIECYLDGFVVGNSWIAH
jgi:hypothetical protein